jgi:hypothetical protein
MIAGPGCHISPVSGGIMALLKGFDVLDIIGPNHRHYQHASQ